MKFNSAVNYKFKINLISCLLERAYNICSSYQSLSNEINNLRRYFCQNGYPVKLVEKQIGAKLNQLYSPPIKPDTVPKQDVYVKIPFMHDAANESLDKSLRNLVGKFYPQINLSIIFQNKNSVGSFFNFKDKIPQCVRSNVVYKYSCSHCNATYVGESSRHFHTRVSEHRGISPRTNRPYSKTPNSNIYKHFLDTNHSIDSNNFSIIFSTSDTSIKVAESIFIHKLSPSLNGTMYSTPLQILG